ncbi:MAG: phosphotransferase [Umezawaea sp.]
MTAAVFVKSYQDPRRATAARAHREWLAALDSGVRVPDLRSAEPLRLIFEHLGDRQPGAGDLGALAQALGRLHAAAYTEQLHAARLDAPYTSPSGLVIVDFVSSRRELLDRVPVPVSGRPVAIYKDANIRNFLLTDDGVAIVDFDDLTLAPFGYDLAKLVVSTAMTHGRLDPGDVEQALDVYNSYTSEADGDVGCSLDQLKMYAEFHHVLTARYLHHNGYHHAWPQVRPWREAEAPQ